MRISLQRGLVLDKAHRNFAYVTPRISAPTLVHHGAPTLFEVYVKLLLNLLLAGQIGLSSSKLVWCTEGHSRCTLVHKCTKL